MLAEEPLHLVHQLFWEAFLSIGCAMGAIWSIIGGYVNLAWHRG